MMADDVIFDVVVETVAAGVEEHVADVVVVEAVGPPGLSAYELAVEQGFAGTVDEWLDSLHGGGEGDGGGGGGKDGKDGVDGKSAYQLAVDAGFVGDLNAWLASLHGADGASGRDGVDGSPGRDGADGASGAPGIGITAGNGEPTGTEPAGSLYLDVATGDLYRAD